MMTGGGGASSGIVEPDGRRGRRGGVAMRIMTATFRYFVGFYFRVIRGDISDLAVTIFPPCRRSRLVADRL
jgi:hypothetical protein